MSYRKKLKEKTKLSARVAKRNLEEIIKMSENLNKKFETEISNEPKFNTSQDGESSILILH